LHRGGTRGVSSGIRGVTFQNQTASWNFEKVFEKLGPLVNEKDKRGLAAGAERREAAASR